MRWLLAGACAFLLGVAGGLEPRREAPADASAAIPTLLSPSVGGGSLGFIDSAPPLPLVAGLGGRCPGNVVASSGGGFCGFCAFGTQSCEAIQRTKIGEIALDPTECCNHPYKTCERRPHQVTYRQSCVAAGGGCGEFGLCQWRSNGQTGPDFPEFIVVVECPDCSDCDCGLQFLQCAPFNLQGYGDQIPGCRLCNECCWPL